MTSSPHESSNRDARLEQALAEYLRAADAGEPVDQQVFLAKYADLADDLKSFFANRAAMEQMAGKLNSAANDATLGPHESAIRDEQRIRYFGDYELLDELGRGGMGVVYRARQTSLNRLVALKMILAGNLAAADDVLRFRQEAEAAANLDHSFIAPIYEIGEHLGQHYFSMKLVEGRSLGAALPDLRRNTRQGVELLAKVARGVHHAHQRGVLHRDLKPANILLDGDDTPYITDFGLAKRVEGGSDLTKTGAVVGTPSYMAPEQATAEKQLSTAVDVYSLGAMLYELLAGQPPFRGASPMETLLQVVSNEPAAPRSLNPAADRDLEVIALKCLQKDPTERYDSAAALADDLDRWLRGEPILARPVTFFEQSYRWCRRNPVTSGTAFLAVFFLVFGAIISGLFALEASRQAGEARKQEEVAVAEAEKAKTEERRANANAATAEANLKVSQRETARADANATEARAESKRANENATKAEDNLKLALVEKERANKNAESAKRNAAETEAARQLSERHLYVARMNLAQQALEQDEPARTLEVLQKYSDPKYEGLRSFAWYLWWRQACQYRLQLSHGETAVYAVAWSPDGATIATGAYNGEVKLWNAATGELKATFRASNSYVWTVAFSPDGTHLAVTPGVSIWDLSNLKAPVRRLVHGNYTWQRRAIFSPDGKTLAVGKDEAEIELWNWRTGESLGVLKGHTKSTRGLSFSSDGKRLVTGSHDKSVVVWDMEKREQLWQLPAHSDEVHATALSADGKLVATGDEKGNVKLWDVEGKKHLADIIGHTSAMRDLRFTQDGKMLASSGADRRFILWNVAERKPLAMVRSHTKWVASVAFSPDDKSLASASLDGTANVWALSDLLAPSANIVLRGHEKSAFSVAFSPDGATLASGGGDNTIRLWDVASGAPKDVLKGCTLPPQVAWLPDGKRLVSAGGRYRNTFEARLWNLETKDSQPLPVDNKSAIRSLALSRDGKLLCTGDEDAGAHLFDMEQMKPIRLLKEKTSFLNSCVFLSDGKTVVVAQGIFDGASVQRFNSADGTLLGVAEGPKSTINRLAVSPDGRYLAAVGDRLIVFVWNTGTWELTHSLHGHGEYVGGLSFSPDGKTLASASQDGTVRLWDLATGETASILPAGEKAGPVTFSPDGRTLAVALSSGAIRLWRAATPAEVIATQPRK